MGADLHIVRDGEHGDGLGGDADLAAVAVQRAALRRSMVALEDAIAAPAARVTVWTQRVEAALRAVARAWSVHTEVTEAEDGLLDEIVTAAPRLANAVDRLREEHRVVAAALDDELAAVAELPIVEDDRFVAGRRDALTHLLGLLARHRQRGADLTYEAYAVDLGGME